MTGPPLAAAALAAVAVALSVRPAVTIGGARTHRVPGDRSVVPRFRRGHRQDVDLTALAALADLLRAGTPAAEAFSRATSSAWPRAAAAAGAGLPVAAVLRAEGGGDRPVARRLAPVWHAVESRGAPAADSVGRLLAAERAVAAHRGEVTAATAAVTVTSRILATLPVLGLAVGSLLGASPVPWLVGTGPGRVCLAAGLAFQIIGVLWLRRIAAGVGRP